MPDHDPKRPGPRGRFEADKLIGPIDDLEAAFQRGGVEGSSKACPEHTTSPNLWNPRSLHFPLNACP